MSREDKIKVARLSVSFILFIILFVMDKIGCFENLKWYITLVIFAAPYLLAGYDVLMEAFENIFHGEVFDEAFLMMLASIGAFAVGEYEEAVAVMIFYQLGEFLSDYAVERSRDSIEQLMDICPEWANLYVDGEIREVSPGEVKISDVIVIKAGERVPLDGVVVEGSSFLDTSALTGESVKRKVNPGDEVLSGCLNGEGTIRLRVTKAYEDSTVARILEMIENTADKKSKTESFITRFARIYTPVVTVSAALLALLPPLLMGGDFGMWIRRACIFLVISCPCALVISVPLSFFAGIGVASSNGILVKGGNFLEMLSNLKLVAFDKTGTITEGNFKVKDIVLYGSENDFTRQEILQMASALEQYSNHPIAQSIREEYEAVDAIGTQYNVSDISEMPGYGVKGMVNGVSVQLGGDKLLKLLGIGTSEHNTTYVNQHKDSTVVHFIYNNNLIASVIVGDEIKASSGEAIHALKKEGIERCVMLTGDRDEFAKAVSETVGIDEVRSELLPADKVSVIEELLESYHGKDKQYVAFAGDGINDAPSLMRADIGIAMGMGSDAAIEAADIVLADNNLMQIAKAIKISRKTVRLASENIVFALAVKVLVLLLGAFGIVSMWLAVFADVGVALITVLNSMRIKNMVY